MTARGNAGPPLPIRLGRYRIRVPPSTDQGPLVDRALREIAKGGFDDVVLSTID